MQWPSSMRDNIRKHFSIRLLTLAATLRLLCHHAAVAKMDLWSPTKNPRSLWTSDTFCFYTPCIKYYSKPEPKTDKQICGFLEMMILVDYENRSSL